jgi:DNA polymerase-3 subunit alpha
MTQFVSLHNQTSYSLLDSLIDPKALFNKARDLGMPAVAITDHGSLGAAWDALKASRATGVKLIMGCECYFVDQHSNVNEKFRHIILLAKNATGYRNILTINKLGFDQGNLLGKRIYPIIDWPLLEKYSDGVICLTACGNGIISQLLAQGKRDKAEEALLRLKDIFKDNLGVEVQPNNMKRFANIYNDEIDQQFLNKSLIMLAKKHDIKVVPACNAHYLNKEDHEVHDAFLAIGSHQPIYSNFRLKYNVPEFYLKSGDEVKSFFARNYGEEFAQQICDNTVHFADMCETPDWIDPKFSNPSGKELPIFPVKDEKDYQQFKEWSSQQSEECQKLDEDKQFLRYRCNKFFDTRIKSLTPENRKVYEDRLVEELDVIEYHGFSSYMLIVADFISWAKSNNIAVGPGRGSAGGSLIAYLISIHEADPIKYNLIFARFHNKEKSAYPDIDTDIAPSGRARVQEYLKNKYGEDRVAHVSNVNTITPKVYIRDISRVCELGGSKEAAVKIGNDVSGIVPADIKSIDEALNKLPLFAEYCKKYPEFIKYKEICGKFRAWATHAGGIIISARPLTGLVPVRKDKDGAFALEYDKDKAEENGLVKMDILGLSTLDTITDTLRLIKEHGLEAPNEINYEYPDTPTYNLISSGDTFGVFQFGTSGGTIDLCKKVKPTSITDLANITALARPSAKDIREDFIKTKNGIKKVNLLHPKLERAFGSTYGFGLYEECLMYLAQDIAGWSLHSADRLRKLTKEKGKNPKKAKQWRSEFIADAVKNNIQEILAERIWDEIIDLFGNYGFNAAHALLYSITTYNTAYLKAHYPVQFLMANLMAEVNSNSPDSPAKISKIKKEIRQHKVKILPPNINLSKLQYTIVDSNKLLTGLDAIKFVGDDAIKDIIAKRPFKSFYDFMSRVDSSTVRSNSIQALVGCGAMDDFKIPRKLMFLYCSDYRKKLTTWMKKHDETKEEFVYPWPNELEWKLPELYALESYYIGEAFACKTSDAYGRFFKDNHDVFYSMKKMAEKSKVDVRCIVKSFFEFKVKSEKSKNLGKTMVKAIIEDRNGDQCSCTIFPDRWELIQSKLKLISSKAVFDAGLALYFNGTVNTYEDEFGLILNDVHDIVLQPGLPADLKAKKINLKDSKKTLKDDKDQKLQLDTSVEAIVERMEDMLYDEGLIELNDEIQDD